ncbi:hypothetical protein ABZ651_33975, partial [Streptomyces sp. NPDC007070]
GRPGRLALAAACAGCVRGRTSVTLTAFARLAGEGLRVVAAPAVAPAPAASATAAAPASASRTVGAAALPDGLGVPELVAEAALLQARLDWFQSQLARLGEHGAGGTAGRD